MLNSPLSEHASELVIAILNQVLTKVRRWIAPTQSSLHLSASSLGSKPELLWSPVIFCAV